MIGTEEETYALLGAAPATVFAGRRLEAAQITELDGAIDAVLAATPATRWCSNAARGARRCTVRGRRPSPWQAFPVTVLNTVGAGDAFAGGLLYGRCQGWDWPPVCAWPMPAAPSW
jgi:5-dehydro-2-deoxygluconokinase